MSIDSDSHLPFRTSIRLHKLGRRGREAVKLTEHMENEMWEYKGNICQTCSRHQGNKSNACIIHTQALLHVEIMPNTFQKHVQHMAETCPKQAIRKSKSNPTNGQYMPEAYGDHARSMSNTSPTIAGNMPGACPKHCQHKTNTHPE